MNNDLKLSGVFTLVSEGRPDAHGWLRAFDGQALIYSAIAEIKDVDGQMHITTKPPILYSPPKGASIYEVVPVDE